MFSYISPEKRVPADHPLRTKVVSRGARKVEEMRVLTDFIARCDGRDRRKMNGREPPGRPYYTMSSIAALNLPTIRNRSLQWLSN